MTVTRRELLVVGAATVTAVGTAAWAPAHEGVDMYGLIGKGGAVIRDDFPRQSRF